MRHLFGTLLLATLLATTTIAETDPAWYLSGAIARGKTDEIRTLLAGNPGLANRLSKQGNAPLHMALSAKASPAVVQVLLQGGANPNLPNAARITPLSLAVSNGNLEGVRILLAADANPNLAGAHGLTPLHRSVMLTDLKAARAVNEMLLQNGAKPNLPDEDGKTPLHRALLRASANDAAIAPLVEQLLQAGADPNRPLLLGAARVSPLQYARQLKLTTTAEVLLKAGARVK